MDFKTGGQKVILRLVEAYGFSTRQMLCDHLGVSKSTLATRFMRDIFPAEWVIQCALETGASLSWLVDGKGNPFDDIKNDIIKLERKKIINDKLVDSNYFYFDKTLLNGSDKNLFSLVEDNKTFILDENDNQITDGLWLVAIDCRASLRRIIRTPGGKVIVTKNEASFECDIDSVNFLAKVIIEINDLKIKE